MIRIINLTPPKKATLANIAITITIPYSLKNKYTNISLPISTLNPLINSLSPSSKSKGARFLSIKDKVSHKINQNNNNSHLETGEVIKLKLLVERRKYKKTIIKATSYESLCKIPRIPPNLEKALVELHPVIIIA